MGDNTPTRYVSTICYQIKLSVLYELCVGQWGHTDWQTLLVIANVFVTFHTSLSVLERHCITWTQRTGEIMLALTWKLCPYCLVLSAEGCYAYYWRKKGISILT